VFNLFQVQKYYLFVCDLMDRFAKIASLLQVSSIQEFDRAKLARISEGHSV
jgi:hypothetical protein